MSQWEYIEEDGNKFWVSPEHGNVCQLGEASFVALLPKVVKLGPFKTLEEAQGALQNQKENLNLALELFNETLVGSK